LRRCDEGTEILRRTGQALVIGGKRRELGHGRHLVQTLKSVYFGVKERARLV